MDESLITKTAKSLLRRTEARGHIGCNLTLSWVIDRLKRGKCEITGIDFVLNDTSWEKYGPSIDRIDSSLGYFEENCRMVVLQYNLAKNAWTNQDVIQFAKDVVKNEKVTAIAALADLQSSLVALGAGNRFDEYWANVEEWING